MLESGILNPQILSLLGRVRYTNSLVIADCVFPFTSGIEIIDISLVGNIPTVLQVLEAVRLNFKVSRIYMGQEFQENNSPEVRAAFTAALQGINVGYEPHVQFKQRVAHTVGVIRTGDKMPYSSMVLVSG
jgi:D-ribose pyranase